MERRPTIVKGDRIRNWGGWYRHDRVLLDGVEIGRIQVRRRNQRIETLTLGPSNSCVLGSDVNWLLRQVAPGGSPASPSAPQRARMYAAVMVRDPPPQSLGLYECHICGRVAENASRYAQHMSRHCPTL